MSKPSITAESRKTLYYNKYEYKARFDIIGFHLAAHAKTVKELDKRLEYYVRNSKSHGKFIREISNEALENRDKLAKFVNWRNKNSEQIVVRSEGPSCSVFSNDLDELKKLSRFMPGVTFNGAELYGDPELIELYEPKHNFRIYLRNKNIRGTNFVKELSDFLTLHSKVLFPSKALKNWVEQYDSILPQYSYNRYWLASSHYIEYDEESTRTLLAFFLDGYLGKSYKVVKRER